VLKECYMEYLLQDQRNLLNNVSNLNKKNGLANAALSAALATSGASGECGS
jgi:hypothetical protein